MTKSEKIFRIAAALLFLIALFVMIWLNQKNQEQQTRIYDMEDTLEHSSQEIGKLKNQKANLDNDLRRKQLDIDGLNTLMADKDKEIDRLIAAEDSARMRINELNAGIIKISEDLRDMQSHDSTNQRQVIDDFMEVLNREKDAMQGELDRYKATIVMLQEEKAEAIATNTKLRNEMLNIIISRDSLAEALWAKDSTFRQYQLDVATVKKITENTKITLHEVTLSKGEKNKGKMNKLNDRNREKWNHSAVVFSIDHPEAELLRGEQFALRIQDLDKGVPVELYERNPAQTDLRNYLMDFSATNGKITKTHTNYQRKESNNYEIQFLLIRDGDEHLLYNGKFPLVKDGEMVKPKLIVENTKRYAKDD